jgi:DNA-binding XRE family transcriptional regulator
MKQSKRKKLEQAGWRVGTAAEFLRLDEAEAGLIELRIVLGRSLRELRTRRGLTQAQAAAHLSSSQSRLAKMESADPSVTIDLLIRSLMALGATRRQVARAIDDG